MSGLVSGLGPGKVVTGWRIGGRGLEQMEQGKLCDVCHSVASPPPSPAQSSDTAGYDEYVEGVEPEETASLETHIAEVGGAYVMRGRGVG